MGFLSLLYGVVVYLLSFGTILCTIAFVGNLPVSKTIHTGATGSLPAAIAIDLLLLGLFAIQHSVMARPSFKRAWTKPRSTSCRAVYLWLVRERDASALVLAMAADRRDRVGCDKSDGYPRNAGNLLGRMGLGPA